LYSTAVLLIEAVMLTAADSTDRRTLQTFADAFKDQLNACKQRSSLLFQPIAGQSQYATGMTFGTVPSTISTQFFALN
jgi:predicted YcjX-like family ATPase